MSDDGSWARYRRWWNSLSKSEQQRHIRQINKRMLSLKLDKEKENEFNRFLEVLKSERKRKAPSVSGSRKSCHDPGTGKDNAIFS